MRKATGIWFALYGEAKGLPRTPGEGGWFREVFRPFRQETTKAVNTGPAAVCSGQDRSVPCGVRVPESVQLVIRQLFERSHHR